MNYEQDLNDHFDLDEVVVNNFERDGYGIFRKVFQPETLEHFSPLIREATDKSLQTFVPMEERSAYDQAFIQEMNLWRRYEDILPLVFSKKLARMAAELIRVDGVRLYHDQALTKEKRGGKTPWHCDQYYWPLSTDRMVTVWIPLVDVPFERGPLSFMPQSQRTDFGRHLDISDAAEAEIFAHPQWNSELIDEQPFALGDVSYHFGWTFHGAHPNNTDLDRPVFTIIYFADGACLVEPVTEGQRGDQVKWLPDSIINEPITSKLNPLLWQRK